MMRAAVLVVMVLLAGAVIWLLSDGPESPKVDALLPGPKIVGEGEPVDEVAPSAAGSRVEVVAPRRPLEAAVMTGDDAWVAEGAQVAVVRGRVHSKSIDDVSGIEVRVVSGLVGGADVTTPYARRLPGITRGAKAKGGSPPVHVSGARSQAVGFGVYDPITLEHLCELAPVRTTTDAEGRFECRAALGPGASLVLTRSDLAPKIERLDLEDAILQRDGSWMIEVGYLGTVIAHPAVRVFGDVVDEHSAAVEGVGVALALTSDVCQRTETDTDGRYEFLSTRFFTRLLFERRGFPDQWSHISRSQGARALENAYGETVELHVDTMEFTSTVSRSGRVVGPAGRPIEGAEVLATSNPIVGIDSRFSGEFDDSSDSILLELECDVALSTRRAITDVDGRFVLEGLDPTSTLTLYARAPDFEPGRLRKVAPQGDDVTLSLSALDRLFVDVTDVEGAALANASLSAWRMTSEFDGRPLSVRRTDDEERFEVLGTGTFATVFEVSAPGFAARRIEINGRAGEPHGRVHRVMLAPALSLTVELRDEVGEPVVTMLSRIGSELLLYVTLYGQQSQHVVEPIRVPDADGRVVWSNLSAGEYRVSLSTSRWPSRGGLRWGKGVVQPRWRTVHLSESTTEVFALVKSGQLNGSAATPSGESAWETIELTPVGDQPDPTEAIVLTQNAEPRATFGVASMVPGAWRLEVDGIDRGVHHVVAGEVPTVVDIVVDTVFDVDVIVLATDGAPFSGLAIYRDGERGRQVAETDEAGRASLRFVRAGRHELFTQRDFLRRPLGVVDVATDTAEATFTVARGGTLRGSILELERKALAWWQDLFGRHLGRFEMTDDGAFVVEGLLPGEYVLRVRGALVPFEILDGRTTEVVATAVEAASLACSFTAVAPEASQAASMIAWGLDAGLPTCVAHPLGRKFTFFHLPAGRYRVAAFQDDLFGVLQTFPSDTEQAWLRATMGDAHEVVLGAGDRIEIDLHADALAGRP